MIFGTRRSGMDGGMMDDVFFATRFSHNLYICTRERVYGYTVCVCVCSHLKIRNQRSLLRSLLAMKYLFIA